MNVSTRRGRGRPVGGQRVVDRDALLDVAERVIARDGRGASLESIAREAGVTKPIVYDRIGSRAELSNALAERLSARLLESAAAAITSAELSHAVLADFFRRTFETIGAHRELFLYVTRGSADDNAERTLYLARASAAPLTDLLVAWRQHCGADADAAIPWAYGIIGMLNLVAVWWLEEGGGPAAELADQLAALVWKGIGDG